MKRCGWVSGDVDYQHYHDKEWGRPVHNDRVLFEMLCLEGAQAGLSWITVLKKRDRYREVFYQFEIQKVSALPDDYLESLLSDAGIIRNRLKVWAFRTNAQKFLEVQAEFGSFADYLWGFVDGEPIINNPKTLKDVPVNTELSDRIAKDLKKRGFKFVGTTIIYAYLQAVGVVNDHTTDCFLAGVKS